jgi:hypothetical protein
MKSVPHAYRKIPETRAQWPPFLHPIPMQIPDLFTQKVLYLLLRQFKLSGKHVLGLQLMMIQNIYWL